MRKGARLEVARDLSWEQVVGFRLQRHHLLERAPRASLVSVAADMAGVQAQVLSAAGISLWARVRDLSAPEVRSALESRRTLVRAWCMRRTVHLLPSRELSLFVRGSTRRPEREVRWVLHQGIPKRKLEETMGAVLAALDEPRTRSEMAEQVGRSLGVPVRLRQGGGWGNRSQIPWLKVGTRLLPADYLLHLAGAYGVICSGLPQGNLPTFVRADAWLPGWRDMSVARAEPELLRRYLRAYGPATPQDFSLWSGMRVGDAREIWSSLPEIVPVRVEGWEAGLLRNDLREMDRAERRPRPLRLLPYFDSFLLGSQEREHLVAVQYRKRVFRDQGWIAPVLLVEGRIQGTWAHSLERGALKVQVEPFVPLSRPVPSGIQEEAQDLGRFLGSVAVAPVRTQPS